MKVINKKMKIMKKTFFIMIAAGAIMASSVFTSCTSTTNEGNEDGSMITASTGDATALSGQANVQDDVSQKDVVKVAVGSPNHTTLVKAVQAAGLVNSLANAGPFTVFAPVNAAFDALPKGTVANLLKPENKGTLEDVLQYHVTVSTYDTDKFFDGQVLGQVNGDNIKVSVKDGQVTINDAKILASVRASNGIVHVIDKVLLPPNK